MKCLNLFRVIIVMIVAFLSTSCTPTLKSYISKQSKPSCGVAIFEGFKHTASPTGGQIPSYTLITNEGERIEHKLCLITPSRHSTERYVGCKFRCWYNAENPQGNAIYPCVDSLIFDQPSFGQVYGCLSSVKRKQNLTYVCYNFVSNGNIKYEWHEYIPLQYYEICKIICERQESSLIDFYLNPSKESRLIPQINREFLDSLLINNKGHK